MASNSTPSVKQVRVPKSLIKTARIYRQGYSRPTLGLLPLYIFKITATGLDVKYQDVDLLLKDFGWYIIVSLNCAVYGGMKSKLLLPPIMRNVDTKPYFVSRSTKMALCGLKCTVSLIVLKCHHVDFLKTYG